MGRNHVIVGMGLYLAVDMALEPGWPPLWSTVWEWRLWPAWRRTWIALKVFGALDLAGILDGLVVDQTSRLHALNGCLYAGRPGPGSCEPRLSRLARIFCGFWDRLF